jgi:hypothetical protein
MSENELDYFEEEKPKKLQFGWVLPILFKPRQTLKAIAEKNHSVWLVPLLLLMVTALVLVLVSAPVSSQNAPPMEMPPDFEYFSPEQQEQFLQAVDMGSSPINTIVFPLLLRYAGIWISWFLLGSILHLSLTLNGSRSSNRSALNLVAWSSIPFVIRDIVQIIAILITKQLILKPGLSGFLADGALGFTAFLMAVLALVDFYLIWQIVLLVLGAQQISGLKSGKALLAVLIAVIVFLALKGVPGFLAAQLSTLSTGGMFF